MQHLWDESNEKDRSYNFYTIARPVNKIAKPINKIAKNEIFNVNQTKSRKG